MAASQAAHEGSIPFTRSRLRSECQSESEGGSVRRSLVRRRTFVSGYGGQATPNALRLSVKIRKISQTAVHGLTTNLRKRFREHNDARSAHTSKFCPWILVAYFAFLDRPHAVAFEKY